MCVLKHITYEIIVSHISNNTIIKQHQIPKENHNINPPSVTPLGVLRSVFRDAILSEIYIFVVFSV